MAALLGLPSKDSLRSGPLPEHYQLGEITEAVSVDPGSLGIAPELAPRAAYSVEVTDPYIGVLDPELVQTVRAEEGRYDRFVRLRRESKLWLREVGTAYTDEDGQLRDNKRQWGDPVAHKMFFDGLGSDALKEWLELVPSANALGYLSDPLTLDKVVDKKGIPGSEIDDVARLWMTACTDAIGIRSRGTVMAELVKSYVDGIQDGSGLNDMTRLKWMSVACGTALPAMMAALRARIQPNLMLVDIDGRAMRATEELSQEIGFKGKVSQHELNIFDDNETANLRGFLGSNGDRPRVIDLMGIFEYTGKNLGIDPAKFLRSYYDMLHPGGRLILGQMRSDRPVLDFTMGVVGWPWVETRTLNELMEVIAGAGIPTGAVQLVLPQDGVYTVGVIDKPLAEEKFAVEAAAA